MICDLETKTHNNEIQAKIKSDLLRIKQCDKILIKSDKTGNWYTIEVCDYQQQMRNLITKDYKLMNQSEVKNIDIEASYLAKQLDISDRIDCISKERAFMTVKDHKPDFPNRFHD